MKKIFGLLSLFVYILSTNALVHANSMGVFSSNESASMSSCHAMYHRTSNQNNNQNDNQNTTTQNNDCCELVYSNQYTQNYLQIENIHQIVAFIPQQIQVSPTPYINTQKLYLFSHNNSPGRNPDIKYQKFSDLTGSIVDLA